MFHPYLNHKKNLQCIESQLHSKGKEKEKSEDKPPHIFSASPSCHDINSLCDQWHLTGKLTHKKLENIAKKFTFSIRNKIAAKVQENMLSSGTDWKTHTGIKCVKSISGNNLRNLYKKIGKLSHYEIVFLKRFFGTNFLLTHTTNQNILDESGHAKLFSRQKLLNKGIAFPLANTQEADLKQLATDDHVFFSIEESGQKGKVHSRFGRYKFSFPLENVSSSKNALMHLFDPITKAFPYPPKWLKGFECLDENDQNTVMKHLNEHVNGLNTLNSFFHGDHILPGLAFSIIERCRYLPEKMNKDILEKSDLNSVINGLFRPQILFPKQFIAKPVDIHDSNYSTTNTLADEMSQNFSSDVNISSSNINSSKFEENTVSPTQIDYNLNTENITNLPNPITSINGLYGTHFNLLPFIDHLHNTAHVQQDTVNNNVYQFTSSLDSTSINNASASTSLSEFENILSKMSSAEFSLFLDDMLKNISNDEIVKFSELLHNPDETSTFYSKHDMNLSSTPYDDKAFSQPYSALHDQIESIANMTPEAFEKMLNSGLSSIDSDLLKMIKSHNGSDVNFDNLSSNTSGKMMLIDKSEYPLSSSTSITNSNIIQQANNDIGTFSSYTSGILQHGGYSSAEEHSDPTKFHSIPDGVSFDSLTLEELINTPVDQLLNYITPKLNHSLPLQSEPFFSSLSPYGSLPDELQSADFWLSLGD
ncbi:hypothetical protein NXS97_21305 [Pantoea sp. B623]|uniref:hypothetical protein n=1 Tax=Pantoea TaxID=53335 RepID=UPI000E24ECF3|nr:MULTISPECIES: hypothetical protein [Pantoea]MCS4496689.1 hypothetical protein [Pantoea sp. B623]REF10053.1 hypothetical protein C7428_2352 [Pantoea ananatis]